MQKKREISLVQVLIVGAMLLVTIKYRWDLSEAQQINNTHLTHLSQLQDKFNSLKQQHKQMQDFYYTNYEQVVSYLQNDLRRMNQELELVKRVYQLNNRLFVGDDRLKELSPSQRISRIEHIIDEESDLLNYLEELLKDKIRERKYEKMDQLASYPYFQYQSMRSNWQLLKGNIHSQFQTEAERSHLRKYQQKEEIRIQEQYQISKYEKELPFCIIVPSYNNAKDYRYEFNLQSILNQQYNNYHVIIIDDASPDKTGKHIQRYLQQHKIPETKVKLIINSRQRTAVPNLHMAATKHCKKDQIGFFVDGDDELVGTLAFKIFNAVYQSKQPAMAYSIAFQYWTGDQLVKDNWSQEYTLQEKRSNKYRDVPQKISHLRSFRIDLYLQIKEQHLKDENGQWFTSTYDEVLCLPMLEMSCGKIEVIHEYLYLYMFGTGYNDRMVDQDLQGSIARKIKNTYPKYTCDPRFAIPL